MVDRALVSDYTDQHRMNTRQLGSSGIEMGEIGLGTWSLSGEGYGPMDLRLARKTIEAAMMEGVSFVETAGCYGPDGAIERLLGEILRDHGRKALFVCTRIGVDRGPDLAISRKRFDRAGLLALADASLARLGTDRVDAFMLHNPLTETLTDPRQVAMNALRELRTRGSARLIGVSVTSADTARAALAAGVDLIELPYSLLYPTLLHLLSGLIAAKKVGVIVRSPLAYGLLGGTWGADRKFVDNDHRRDRWTPAELARRVRQRDAAKVLIHEHVKTLSDAAIRFVLSNKLVSVAVVGARTPAHAVANAHATDVLPYLAGDDLSTIGERMRANGVS